MEPIHHYIDLSWAMVGIFAIAHQPLLFHIPGIDKDEVAAEEHFFRSRRRTQRIEIAHSNNLDVVTMRFYIKANIESYYMCLDEYEMEVAVFLSYSSLVRSSSSASKVPSRQ